MSPISFFSLGNFPVWALINRHIGGKRCRPLEIILPVLLVIWIVFLLIEHYLGSDVMILLIKASLSS